MCNENNNRDLLFNQNVKRSPHALIYTFTITWDFFENKQIYKWGYIDPKCNICMHICIV